jgi:hypothetical protein
MVCLPKAKQNMTHWPLRYGNGSRRRWQIFLPGYLICRQIPYYCSREHGWCIRIERTAGYRSEDYRFLNEHPQRQKISLSVLVDDIARSEHGLIMLMGKGGGQNHNGCGYRRQSGG